MNTSEHSHITYLAEDTRLTAYIDYRGQCLYLVLSNWVMHWSDWNYLRPYPRHSVLWWSQCTCFQPSRGSTGLGMRHPVRWWSVVPLVPCHHLCDPLPTLNPSLSGVVLSPYTSNTISVWCAPLTLPSRTNTLDVPKSPCTYGQGTVYLALGWRSRQLQAIPSERKIQ